jgi:hypothetical protein
MKPHDIELVAEVTGAHHCANFIRSGQTFVFGADGVLDAATSTAPLCLGIIAKLQPALLMAQDRLAEGLHPVSPRFNTFDCFDTGIDHGGTGKVFVRLRVRDRKTGAFIEADAPPAAAP